MEYSKPKIISFISASGGVGKTKLSLVYTYFLRKERKENVLLIDLDPTAGASLEILSDEKYDEYIRNRRSFAHLLEDYKRGQNVDFSRYKLSVELYQKMYIDLIIPGDNLIDIIDDFWRTGSAGPQFKEKLEAIIPLSRYTAIIIDTAPFFDPRYIILSLYVSDYFVIPLRPNIVDIKRTYRMIERIKDDLRIALAFKKYSEDVESFLRKNVIGVLNLVPTRGAESDFARVFVGEKTFEDLSGAKTKERVKRLIEAIAPLRNRISFLSTYIRDLADIRRFPREQVDLKNFPRNYVEQLDMIISGTIIDES